MDECSICLEEHVPQQEHVTYQCKHWICKRCFNTLPNKYTCVMCRILTSHVLFSHNNKKYCLYNEYSVTPSLNHFKITSVIGDAAGVLNCAICREKFDDQCFGCKEKYKNDSFKCLVIQSLRCQHKYHYHCITRWLKIRNVCPLCDREWIYYSNN